MSEEEEELSKCPIHGEKLVLMCKTCSNVPVCWRCVADNGPNGHNGHNLGEHHPTAADAATRMTNTTIHQQDHGEGG